MKQPKHSLEHYSSKQGEAQTWFCAKQTMVRSCGSQMAEPKPPL